MRVQPETSAVGDARVVARRGGEECEAGGNGRGEEGEGRGAGRDGLFGSARGSDGEADFA